MKKHIIVYLLIFLVIWLLAPVFFNGFVFEEMEILISMGRALVSLSAGNAYLLFALLYALVKNQ